MTLVIDASMVVAGLIDSGTDGRWAEALLASGSLAAPHMMTAEAANILRRSAAAGAISAEQASLAHADLLDLRVEFLSLRALRNADLGTPGKRDLLRRLVRGDRGRSRGAARHVGRPARERARSPLPVLDQCRVRLRAAAGPLVLPEIHDAKAFSPGRSRCPENLVWGCGLPAGGSRCRSVVRFLAGVADRVVRGGRGWDDGRGLPVTPVPLGMRARARAWRRDLDLRVASCCLEHVGQYSRPGAGSPDAAGLRPGGDGCCVAAFLAALA